MNIMELGAIGELLGGVAVVASLVYVGLQIRQNTAATRAASHHAVTDSFNEINLSLAREPALAEVWCRGSQTRVGLSDDERIRFDLFLLSYLRVFETLFYQSQVGAAEPRLMEAEERSLESMFALPGYREWWHENPYALDATFRSYVESFFSRSAAATLGA